MSYATVQEANEYVSSHYLSTDSERDRWNSLTDDDKQILLNKGKDIIDRLPLTGRTTELNQEDAFPRNGQIEVPKNVKFAEIELALAYSDPDLTETQAQYQRMVNYGVSSYSIGNFSESLLSYQKNSAQLRYGLISPEAERWLQPWTCGGFCIE